MIGTRTLTPAIEKDKIPGSQKPGACGFPSEKADRDMERTGEAPSVFMPELLDLKPVLGSIKFNDVKEAGVELFNMTFGTGKFAQAKTEAQSEVKGPESAEPRKLTEPEIHAWFARINTAKTQVAYENSLNESIRLIGRVADANDAQRVGTTKEFILRRHVLHDISELDSDIEKKAEYQQDAAETASVKPAGVPGQNDLINNEGGSKYTGVSSSIG